MVRFDRGNSNNLLTIVVAVAVSWAFLTATQPLEKYQLGKENEELRSELIETKSKNKLLQEQVNIQKLKISELEKALAELKTKENGGRK
jgi:septal ring factor EnvC (AmiA/AmiB activator)